MAIIYAKLLKQHKYKYLTVFSARFDKQDEDNQVLDESELFNKIGFNQKLTESDITNLDIISPLAHQLQKQEMKDS